MRWLFLVLILSFVLFSSGCDKEEPSKICTPGKFACRNNDLGHCANDGTKWNFVKTCEFGCSNNRCDSENQPLVCGDGLCQQGEDEISCAVDCEIARVDYTVLYQDGFECSGGLSACIKSAAKIDGVPQTFEDFWTYKTVKPREGEPGGAKIEFSTSRAHSGSRSLYSTTPKTTQEDIDKEGGTNKAIVARTGFNFRRSQIVIAEAWFYIPSSETGDVIVFDYETATGQGQPGVRFSLDDNSVTFNRDKIKKDFLTGEGYSPNKFSGSIKIPKNEWFNYKTELKISDQKDGYAKVYINGNLVLNQQGIETISPQLDNFNTIQIGLTARLDEPFEMWTDDVKIGIK